MATHQGMNSKVCSIMMIWSLASVLLMGGGGRLASASQGHFGDTSSSGGALSSNGVEPYAAPEYQFRYGVQDSQQGTDFGHEEERNGVETKGRYKVQLPDGRVQVVSYVADRNGYRADVTYENVGYSSSSSSSSSTSSLSSSSSPAGVAGIQTSESRHAAYSSPSSSSFQHGSPGRSFSTLRTKINGKYYGF